MFKKAQAAMEFLMTYGWAILVVLAAIAALAYFGVLSPDRFLPEKCTMPSGVACLDFTVAAGGDITISLQNAAGFDMESANISLTGITPTGLSCPTAAIIGSMANGQMNSTTIDCTATGVGSGTKIKAKIIMSYVNGETKLPHDKVGELIAKMP